VTQPASQAGPAPQRTGIAMAVIMTGVLMTAVDTTIVVLALPEIQRGLHVALSAVVWVIISFLLVITLLATQVGRLGDMFGRVRMYEAGFSAHWPVPWPGTRPRSSSSASCRGWAGRSSWPTAGR
jgi:MFS family permease